MNFSFVRKRKSVIYNWIISYTLIISIQAVASGCVYFVTKSNIEDEIRSSNELLIGRIRDDIDIILKDVNRLSLEVAGNQSIQSILAMPGLDDSTPYYNIYKASRELYDYKILNSSLIKHYIFLNNLNIVIGPGTINEIDTFYDLYVKSGSNSIKQWLDVMSKKHNGDYRIMPYKDGKGNTSKVVAYMRSLPVEPIGSFSGNMVILLDFSELVNGKNQDMRHYDGRSLYILDENGQVISGINQDKMPDDFDYKEIGENSGNLVRHLGGAKTVISYTTSRINGWKYVTLTPEELFWKRAQSARNIMIGGLLLCIVLGGVISYFYLRKNYNPLKEMIGFLQEKTHSKRDWSYNEYSFLKETLSKTIDQKEKYQLMLEQQNRMLKSSFLAGLLKGRKTAVPVHELLTTYDISFRYSKFTVMAIYILNIDEAFWEDNPCGDRDKYEMAKFIIANVVEELVNRSCCGYITEVDDLMVCLVNLDSGSEDYKVELTRIFDEAKEFIGKYYRMSIRAVAGALHDTLEGLPEAFAEAVQTLEYSRVMGVSGTTFYDEIVPESANSYYYPVEKEYQLVNCIKSGDFDASANILEEIFHRNFDFGTVSLESARFLMLNLMGTVLKITNEIGWTDNNGFIENVNPAGVLMKCHSLADMKEKVFEIVKTICEYVGINSKHTDYKIRDTAIDYIIKNYEDPNLGITSISEKLNKNPNYLSRVFKEQTGEGILEYINKYRISKAKEFLKVGGLNQEEIAIKVGYTNVRTYQRAFKKYEGVSPGKLKL